MAVGGTRAHGMNRTLPLIISAAVLLLVGTVVLSAYTVELGLSKPSVYTGRVAVAVAEIDATLEGEADFREYSEALSAALAAHRNLGVRNAADNRTSIAMGGALDCYSALRESWQAELEGIWDPAIHGDPAYWRSFHQAVALPVDGPVTAADLRELLRQEALVYAREALELVGR